MAERLLHIRRSYQIEGERRWVYWSAVLVADGEETIIASTQPLRRHAAPPYEKWMLEQSRELPAVSRFEHEMRLAQQGKALATELEEEGWEPVEWDASGQVVRMRRG